MREWSKLGNLLDGGSYRLTRKVSKMHFVCGCGFLHFCACYLKLFSNISIYKSHFSALFLTDTWISASAGDAVGRGSEGSEGAGRQSQPVPLRWRHERPHHSAQRSRQPTPVQQIKPPPALRELLRREQGSGLFYVLFILFICFY